MQEARRRERAISRHMTTSGVGRCKLRNPTLIIGELSLGADHKPGTDMLCATAIDSTIRHYCIVELLHVTLNVFHKRADQPKRRIRWLRSRLHAPTSSIQRPTTTVFGCLSHQSTEYIGEHVMIASATVVHMALGLARAAALC